MQIRQVQSLVYSWAEFGQCSQFVTGEVSIYRNVSSWMLNAHL